LRRLLRRLGAVPWRRRLTVRRRLAVLRLRLRRKLRRARHQLCALEWLVPLRSGSRRWPRRRKAAGLTRIGRAAGRIAGGLVHRSLLIGASKRIRNTERENVNLRGGVSPECRRLRRAKEG
jgi:hypothetical protein